MLTIKIRQMGKIETIMSETIERLAKKHDVKANKVIVFIENKGGKIEFIYAIDKKIVKDENDNVVKLNFTKDILNKKFDALGIGMLTSYKLNSFFENEVKSNQSNIEELKLYVTSKDEEAKEIATALFLNFNKCLRMVTLDEVIGIG